MYEPLLAQTPQVLAVFPVLMFFGAITAYVVLLVAVWKLMRAHESIADSVRELVEHLRYKSNP